MAGHWTPEELAGSLRARGEPIATTTVYRNLALLEEAGIIRRAAVGSSADAAEYEHAWGREHHDHLVCAVCGLRVEFAYPAIEVLQEAVAHDHGFTLRRHTLELVGTCPACREAGRS